MRRENEKLKDELEAACRAIRCGPSSRRQRVRSASSSRREAGDERAKGVATLTAYKFNLAVSTDQLEAIGMVAAEWTRTAGGLPNLPIFPVVKMVTATSPNGWHT